MINDVFCKIIGGALPDASVYRDEDVIVIRDVNPQAPVHLLVIPIRHFAGIEDASEHDELLLGKMVSAAHRVALEQGLAHGYRLIINEGEHGGKLVPHLHIHVLGGKVLGPKLVA